MSEWKVPRVVLSVLLVAAIVGTPLTLLAAPVPRAESASATTLLDGLSLRVSFVLLDGLTAMALWDAPLQGWLLRLGGWAQRVTFSGTVLPPCAISFIEKVALHSFLAREHV